MKRCPGSGVRLSRKLLREPRCPVCSQPLEPIRDGRERLAVPQHSRVLTDDRDPYYAPFR